MPHPFSRRRGNAAVRRYYTRGIRWTFSKMSDRLPSGQISCPAVSETQNQEFAMSTKTAQWMSLYHALYFTAEHGAGYMAEHFLNIVYETHNKSYRALADKLGYAPTQLAFFKESFSEMIEPMLTALNELECDISVISMAYEEYNEDFCQYWFLMDTFQENGT